MDLANRHGARARTAAVAFIGCKVSQYDAKAAENALAAAGYEIVPFSEYADIYVINTCAVTNTAESKSKNAVRRALRRNPAAFAAVTGCWARLEPEAIAELGAHAVTGDLSQAINEYFGGGAANADFSRVSLSPTGGRTRAYLKIQDGCDKFCSYCVIPYARGRVESRAENDIVREAEQLVSKGVKEIVLTGIHVASYGKDLKNGSNTGLLDICRAVSGINGIERFRLSSLSPQAVTEEFVNGISALKMCPHFHLSLQSGSESVLESMNRGYTPAGYARAVKLLNAAFPGCAVWSDVIAGFPGESDECFNESVSFIENSGIVKLHVFPFSPRKGTRAFDMKPRIEQKVKSGRVKALLELDTRLYGEYLKRNEGAVKTVLYEEREGEFLCGHTENYIYVKVPKSRVGINEMARVRLGDAVLVNGAYEVCAAEV